jgi:AraC-like DNA-binding protein
LFWYWDGYVQPHARERLLPDGSMCIVFSFRAKRIHAFDGPDPHDYRPAPGAVISGTRSRYFEVDTANMVHTLGIQFKPGGAFPFLGMPANELNEQCVALEDVFGNAVCGLRERLMECAIPSAKFEVVEQWLLSRAKKPLQKHAAVEYATKRFLLDPASQPLSLVLNRIGYSQRHFNQLFADEVGLTPKRFLRVTRFQRVIASIASAESVNWADLALNCGYYDQAHFSHDFRNFSGLTPAEYLSLCTSHLNHVPLLE